MWRLWLYSLGLLLCLGLAACAPPATAPAATDTPEPTPTAEPTRLATLQPMRPAESAIMDKLDVTGKLLVGEARRDLAGRLRVDAQAITLLSAEAMLWSDTSLGCPQPGMMYAQAITPGYRIILEAAGQQYDYHTDQKRVVLCELKP